MSDRDHGRRGRLHTALCITDTSPMVPTAHHGRPPIVRAPSSRELAEQRGDSLSSVIADLTARGLAQLDTPASLTTDARTGLPVLSVGRRVTQPRFSRHWMTSDAVPARRQRADRAGRGGARTPRPSQRVARHDGRVRALTRCEGGARALPGAPRESTTTTTALLRGIGDSPRCRFWPDSISYAETDLTSVRGHRQVTDAYLVSLARACGGVLVTLDSGLAALHSDVSLIPG